MSKSGRNEREDILLERSSGRLLYASQASSGCIPISLQDLQAAILWTGNQYLSITLENHPRGQLIIIKGEKHRTGVLIPDQTYSAALNLARFFSGAIAELTPELSPELTPENKPNNPESSIFEPSQGLINYLETKAQVYLKFISSMMQNRNQETQCGDSENNQGENNQGSIGIRDRCDQGVREIEAARLMRLRKGVLEELRRLKNLQEQINEQCGLQS